MRRVVHSRASDLDGLVLDDDGLFRAWVRGVRASDGVAVWLAAERVYCPPKGVAWLGPSTARWTSNGLGAHRLKSRAIQHAMLEVWERHALTLAIPDGWTSDTVRRFGVALNTPQTRRLRGRGFEVVACLFARRPLPLAGVLLFDLQEQVIPLTAGYACRLSDGEALEAALLEAVQSRLTEIHGAREDVAFSQRVSAESLRLPERRKWHPGSTASALPQTVKSRIVIVELRRTPLFVVKAVGVDLETSELLL
jgi:ribosomal protein S12 methylthiotransferase accessory factor